MIKGWIFDLDGVITDTAEFHFMAWKKLADEEGLEFSREDNEQLRGVSRSDSLKLLLKGKSISQKKFDEMMARKNSDYQELVEKMTPEDALPGARELILAVRKAGLRTAIGSSSRNARRVIELLDMGNLFDGIADGNSVENAKPAPDLFLHAAELLGLSAAECVVVEDAEAGVEAAVAGGMTTVGIGPEERVGRADFVFPDTASIDVEKVMDKKLI